MQNFDLSFSHPFDEKLNFDVEEADATKAIDEFKNIPWKDLFVAIYQTKNEDVYDCYEISFDDSNTQNFSIEIELHKDFEEEIDLENMELRFDISFDFTVDVVKKIFFGLFGEKTEKEYKFYYLENQKLEMTVKCLFAFVHLDFDFLKQNMKVL